MNDAQMEIKSTVTVNTTELTPRVSEDPKDSKEAEKAANKKRRSEFLSNQKKTSGQSYKASTIVIYNCRVVPDWKIPHITTLES